MTFFIARGRDMYTEKLEVLRGLDGFENTLIKNLTPSAVQETLFAGSSGGVPAGRCVSRNSVGDYELGVSGHRVPYFTFRNSAQPSTGAVSDPTPVQLAPYITYKSDADHRVLCYCGADSLELATTEFIAGTYNLNDWLTSADYPTSGSDITIAGKVTNISARSGGGAVLNGADPIVGIVSESVKIKPHRIDMLVFYSQFRPAIQANLTTITSVAP